jgi:hypothetical protein
MKPRDILVATHGHCFDGLASAALFTRLLRALSPGEDLHFRYRSCGYGPGMQTIPEKWLDGDENAILDFRYTPSARLSWYFDHHITGFASDAERDAALGAAVGEAHPEARPQVYYDPAGSSCAKLIAEVAGHLGVDMGPQAELIAWADLIDSARFASAEAATNQDDPVLQLAAVVEHHGDGNFLKKIVPRLGTQPVVDVARSEYVQNRWGPIRASRDAFVRRVEQAGALRDRVVLVDLTDAPIEVAAKFVTYALFPGATYSVTLTRNKQHFKLSVGYNPWSGAPREHDIAAICRRYGGGGHPAVGACSFPLPAEARAREAARVVADELAGRAPAPIPLVAAPEAIAAGGA